jgi:hypothetical protein
VVKHILDANILVRHLNIEYSDFTNVNVQYTTDLKSMRERCPGLKFGRFSRGKNGEDEIIRKNWERLVAAADIGDPVRCITDFKNLVQHSTFSQ